MWAQTVRPEMHKHHPGKKNVEISKMLGEMWRYVWLTLLSGLTVHVSGLTLYMTDYKMHYSPPHRNMSGQEKQPYQTRASELAVAYKDAMQRYVERHLAARAAEETKYGNMIAGT